MSDEIDESAALETTEDPEESELGDAGNTKGPGWVDPETIP